MKLKHNPNGSFGHWQLYPETFSEQEMLDDLWKLLHSVNFPFWSNISVTINKLGPTIINVGEK